MLLLWTLFVDLLFHFVSINPGRIQNIICFHLPYLTVIAVHQLWCTAITATLNWQLFSMNVHNYAEVKTRSGTLSRTLHYYTACVTVPATDHDYTKWWCSAAKNVWQQWPLGRGRRGGASWLVFSVHWKRLQVFLFSLLFSHAVHPSSFSSTCFPILIVSLCLWLKPAGVGAGVGTVLTPRCVFVCYEIQIQSVGVCMSMRL